MYLEFSENVDVNIDVLWNIVTDTFDDSACMKYYYNTIPAGGALNMLKQY